MKDSSTVPTPNIESFAKFRELADGIRIAMLTTVAPDGCLHSRPMATQEVGEDGLLWFFTAKESLKVFEVTRDHHVNIAYSNQGKEVFISVSGTAQLSTDQAKIKELWSPFLKTWFPEGPTDPRVALLCVTVETIDYWEGAGTVVTLFKMAKSAITGQPSKVGEFGHIEPPKA
jgi:general stress protein 26